MHVNACIVSRLFSFIEVGNLRNRMGQVASSKVVITRASGSINSS